MNKVNDDKAFYWRDWLYTNLTTCCTDQYGQYFTNWDNNTITKTRPNIDLSRFGVESYNYVYMDLSNNFKCVRSHQLGTQSIICMSTDLDISERNY